MEAVTLGPHKEKCKEKIPTSHAEKVQSNELHLCQAFK